MIPAAVRLVSLDDSVARGIRGRPWLITVNDPRSSSRTISKVSSARPGPPSRGPPRAELAVSGHKPSICSHCAQTASESELDCGPGAREASRMSTATHSVTTFVVPFKAQ